MNHLILFMRRGAPVVAVALALLWSAPALANMHGTKAPKGGTLKITGKLLGRVGDHFVCTGTNNGPNPVKIALQIISPVAFDWSPGDDVFEVAERDRFGIEILAKGMRPVRPGREFQIRHRVGFLTRESYCRMVAMPLPRRCVVKHDHSVDVLEFPELATWDNMKPFMDVNVGGNHRVDYSIYWTRAATDFPDHGGPLRMMLRMMWKKMGPPAQ